MTGAGMPGMGAGGGGQPAAQPVAQAESPADFTEQVRSRLVTSESQTIKSGGKDERDGDCG